MFVPPRIKTDFFSGSEARGMSPVEFSGSGVNSKLKFPLGFTGVTSGRNILIAAGLGNEEIVAAISAKINGASQRVLAMLFLGGH